MPFLLRATPRQDLAGWSLRSEANLTVAGHSRDTPDQTPDATEHRPVATSHPQSGHYALELLGNAMPRETDSPSNQVTANRVVGTVAADSRAEPGIDLRGESCLDLLLRTVAAGVFSPLLTGLAVAEQTAATVEAVQIHRTNRHLSAPSDGVPSHPIHNDVSTTRSTRASSFEPQVPKLEKRDNQGKRRSNEDSTVRDGASPRRGRRSRRSCPCRHCRAACGGRSNIGAGTGAD